MDFNEISTGDKEKTVYPLMKIIYHSIYCLLLSQPEYKGIEINDDFMLTKPINIGGDEFHKGDHILRVINHNTKIDNTLVKTIDFVTFLSEICKVCGGKSQEHKKMFAPADDSRIEAIVNFIQKIILDKDMVVPKSIIAKYYFSTLLKEKKTKNDIYKIYGLYFFINLFVLFEDKRNLDPIKKALKEEDYYISIMKETSKMFSSNALTSGKRNAIFKATNNLDDINLQFRCKSLATLYNYFYFQMVLSILLVHYLIVQNIYFDLTPLVLFYSLLSSPPRRYIVSIDIFFAKFLISSYVTFIICFFLSSGSSVPSNSIA